MLNGDLIHESSTLNINGGKLIVKGDYHIQQKISETNFTGSKGGILIMRNNEDYILVNGNFITQLNRDYYDYFIDFSGYLTAGTLEVKGNFLQKGKYSFNYVNKHKVILSGESRQFIHSDFNQLVIKNVSGQIIWDKLDIHKNIIYPTNYNLFIDSDFNFSSHSFILTNNLIIMYQKIKQLTLNLGVRFKWIYSNFKWNFIHSGGGN